MLLEKGKISGMLDKINVMLDDLNKSFNEGKLRTVHLCNVVMITNNL